MATLSLAFLGPFTVTYDGQVVSQFRTRSVQALLAYLAVEETANRPQQRDALAELLWPGYPSGSARKNLRQTLYELGRLIPEVATQSGSPAPFTLASRETLQINPEVRFELDTATFTRLVHDGGVDALRSAVELYRGDFLEDFALPDSGVFETWAETWRSHFRREALDALDRLTAIALHRHDFVQGESYARRQLALDDLRESAVDQLMQALAGQGQRSAALIAYDEARLRLQAELGVEPGTKLTALWEQIRAGEIATKAEGPALVTAPSRQPPATTPAHNLPAHATPFIGREAELDQIQRLLVDEEDCRLLTLHGPGGSGKTRLALQAAANLASSTGTPFVDGVWFVPLAPAQRPEEAVYAVAGALSFSFLGSDPAAQQLKDFLRPRRLLLMLDNFEQLVGEKSGALLAELLGEAPGVKLLVTSRTRLQLAGETIFPVPGLTVPPAETPAGPPELDRLETFEGVRLFCERARRVRMDFRLTAENGPAVADICRLVSGMPLAIELAASWAGQLEPEEIATEIASSLDFLETEQYDLPPRQRSLRAVFATSWQMLSDEEKGAINGLSYFAGPVSRDAARQVAGAGLKQLGTLLHKSWLSRDGDGRYSLHPLLCQFASEQLWADPAAGREVAEAHHRYYLSLAERLAQETRGPHQVEALTSLSQELADIRATWNDLLRRGRLEPAVTQLLPVLFHHAEVSERGEELIELVEDALRQATAGSQQRAALLIACGAYDLLGYPIRFDTTGVILPTYKSYVEEAWSTILPEQRPAMGTWGTLLAFEYGSLVDREKGIAAARRMVEALGREGRAWEQAQALYYLGWLNGWNPTDEAEIETAAACAREALALFQAAGDRRESAYTLRILGYTASLRRRAAEAIEYWKAAQEEFTALGDLNGAAIVDWSLGDAYLMQGQVEQAFHHYSSMQQTYESAGQRRSSAYALSKLSLEAARYGTLEYAWATRQQALDIARELDDVFGEAWSVWEMGELYRLEGDASNARFWYDRADSLFVQFDDPNFPSFYHRGLGELALTAGNCAEALQQFAESLSIAEAAGHNWMRAYALDGLARSQHGLGEEKGAWPTVQKALVAAAREVNGGLIMMVLATKAALYVTGGDLNHAIELASFLVENPITWHEPRARAANVLRRALPLLDEETAAAAKERGRQLQLEEVLQAELSRHNGG